MWQFCHLAELPPMWCETRRPPDTVRPMSTQSLRAKHATETRQRIVDVALGLFAQVGFDATTIDRIALAADVSPRTVYRYFPTKEALRFHRFDQRMSGITEHIEARPAGETSLDTLTVVFCQMIDQLRGGPDRGELTSCLIADRSSTPTYSHANVIEQAEQEIVEALAHRAGLPPTSPSLRAALTIAAACLDTGLRSWADDAFTGSFEPHFSKALDAYRQALQPSDALARP